MVATAELPLRRFIVTVTFAAGGSRNTVHEAYDAVAAALQATAFDDIRAIGCLVVRPLLD